MHLKAQITDGEKIIDGIAFGFGKLINVFKNSPTFDLVAVPEINVWNSREIIQLNILDFVAHS